MIDYINRNEHGHILTLEDPIEFLHQDKNCYGNQREIGADSRSFTNSLRAALREDPDIILVGEMRDLETISVAITAAETGHLVFGTLHTTSAIQTVDRVIDVFPHEAQQQVRTQLSATLQGVISQTLIEKVGGGRVCAQEIMIGTDAVRNCVREGKTPQLINVLQTGAQYGMQTLEAGLTELVLQGVITAESAIGKANSPASLQNILEKAGHKVTIPKEDRLPPSAIAQSAAGPRPPGAAAAAAERPKAMAQANPYDDFEQFRKNKKT
jgi:twitching motility protein PilT